MVKISKYWWILALLVLSILVSGCVVQFNLGVPGAPIVSTFQSTPVPTVTTVPVLTPSPTANLQTTDAGLSIVSPNATSKAPVEATATPIANVTNSTLPISTPLTVPVNNTTIVASSNNSTSPINTTISQTDNSSVNSTVTPTAQPTGGVKLIQPSSSIVQGTPQFWQLENTGAAADTYIINATPKGAVIIMPDQLTLQPGEARYFDVFPQGQLNNITITATSASYPNITDSASVTE